MSAATTTRRRRYPPRRAKGLGMAELMIALTIMAMLLTSIAAAFHTSLQTIEENQKVSTVTHNARIVLTRMMAQARRANWIERQTDDAEWMPDVRIEPASFSGPELVEYELDEGTLYYHETIAGKKTSYAILGSDEGVTVNGFTIRFEDEDVWDEGAGKTVAFVHRITADVDLEVDDNRFTVTASTNPRRNLDW